MHGWRIYIWTFVVVLVLSAVGRVILFFKRRDVVSRLDVFEAFAGVAVIPALLGFAYHRAYGFRFIWMSTCIVIFILSVYQFFTPKMQLMYRKGWLISTAVILLQTLVGAPALWALISYSFLDSTLWN